MKFEEAITLKLNKINDKIGPMITLYRILGCPLAESPTEDQLQDLVLSNIEQGKGFYTVAINAEKISYYNKNPQMKEVIDHSGLPFVDGSGALVGLRLLHGVRTDKINMPVRILEICNRTGLPLYMLGAKKDVIQKTVETVKSVYSSIDLVGFQHGYFESEDEVVNNIEKSGARIVMVAMGSPRQEMLARRMLARLPGRVFIGCGGAFDILAGNVVRAPVWIQNAHLEWLYRLIQDPRRIKRQRVLPIFLLRVLLASIRRPEHA